MSDDLETMRARMNVIAKALDGALNPEEPKMIGFALLLYNFGENIEGTGRINYVGNGKREDVLIAIKELAARWEGRYGSEGVA